MAKPKTKTTTQSSFLSNLLGRRIFYSIVAVLAGSGTGGYLVPDMPVIGPMVQEVRQFLLTEAETEVPGLTNVVKNYTDKMKAAENALPEPRPSGSASLPNSPESFGGDPQAQSVSALVSTSSAGYGGPAAPPSNGAQPSLTQRYYGASPNSAPPASNTASQPSQLPVQPVSAVRPSTTAGYVDPNYNNSGYSTPPAQAAPPRSAPQGPGGPETVSIATYNIQVFGTSKLADASVVDKLVQVIRQFDIVAIQEIRSKDDTVLPQFVQRVNATGRRYDFVIGPRLGRTSSKEQYAFIFDSQKIEVQPSSVGTIDDPQALFHRPPLIARFRSRIVPPDRAFTFYLVNIHTDPDDVPNEVDVLADVATVMQQTPSREDDVIILGDLNANDKKLGRLTSSPNMLAVVTNTTTNTRRNQAYDNIIFDRTTTAEYTGKWSVVDMEHWFKISREQALAISDHLPVWATFSAWEMSSKANVASQPVDAANNAYRR